MVSVTDKSEFLIGLCQNDLAKDFVDLFLHGSLTERKCSRTVASDVASLSLRCLYRSDANGFKDLYADFARRKPDADTDWIYDDFVVFALMSSVKRFRIDPTWLIDAIALRKDGKKDGSKNVPSTFISLLRGNYESREAYYQVIVTYLDLVSENKFDEARLNDLFSELWSMEFPFYSSSCLNLLSLKAIEITIRRKGLKDPRREQIVEQFLTAFSRRTKATASTIVNLLYAALIVLVAWLIYQTFEDPSGLWVTIVSSLLTIGGATLLEVFRVRRKIIGVLTQLIQKTWGLKQIP